MALSELDNGILAISVNSLGAELSSLRDQEGRELLWQGGDAWPRRAPILFPIVGRMPGNELLHEGVSYPIGQHGFARDQSFETERLGPAEVAFTLADSEETRTHFPFPFTLRVHYTVDGPSLVVRTTVTNSGTGEFAASLGEHPGFAWPLLDTVPRNEHTIVFETDEPEPVRRVRDGLLLAEVFDTPVEGPMLQLDDALFVDDAIIFDRLRSRSVRYSAPDAPMITVSFPDFPLLGVWSKAPGRFVCIEPWFGMTAPHGFDGPYDTKPGQFTLQPGESREFTYSVTVQQR